MSVIIFRIRIKMSLVIFLDGSLMNIPIFFQQYLKTRDPDLIIKMDQLLHENPPHVPLMFVTYHNLVNPKLRNIVTSPMGFVDFRFAYLLDSDTNT